MDTPAARATAPRGENRRVLHHDAVGAGVVRARLYAWTEGASALTLSSSRSSKDGSKRSGARRCAATRSANAAVSAGMSCGCSAMVYALQEVAKPFAGSLHSHLQCRNADPGDLGNLLVAHFFHVLQQKCLSLFSRQSR